MFQLCDHQPGRFLASWNLVISEPLPIKPTLPSRASGTWLFFTRCNDKGSVIVGRISPTVGRCGSWLRLEDTILGLSWHEATLAAGAGLQDFNKPLYQMLSQEYQVDQVHITFTVFHWPSCRRTFANWSDKARIGKNQENFWGIMVFPWCFHIFLQLFVFL